MPFFATFVVLKYFFDGRNLGKNGKTTGNDNYTGRLQISKGTGVGLGDGDGEEMTGVEHAFDEGDVGGSVPFLEPFQQIVCPRGRREGFRLDSLELSALELNLYGTG